MKVLELGAGRNPIKYEGVEVVHTDFVEGSDIEVVHDLNRIPWPWEDREFDIVLGFHVLEHLEDFVGAVNEIYRILKIGGVAVLTFPHFRSWNAHVDPTHKQLITSATMDYWDPRTLFGRDYGFYIRKGNFLIIKRKVDLFPREFSLLRKLSSPLSYILSFLTDKNPMIMEHFVFPLIRPWEITFIMSKEKIDEKRIKVAEELLRASNRQKTVRKHQHS